MTHRIDLGMFDDAYAGEWVDIAPRRGWADMKRIEQAAAILHPTDTEGEFDVSMNLLEQGIAKLESAVEAWSLKDASGAMLPASREGFLHPEFDDDLGDWLIDQIDAHYAAQKRTQAQRGKSVAS